MKRSRAALAALAVAACMGVGTAAGCGDDMNWLEGSLSEVYNIHFETVRARLYSSELAVEYVDPVGAVPVRLTVRRDDATITANHDYDLMEVGDVSGRSSDDREIPRFTEGTLELRDYAEANDGVVSGHFNSQYSTGRDSLTLSGEFHTTLEIVGDLGE